MDQASPREPLSDQQYLVLLLRLLVDHQGQAVQGEIGSIEGDQDVEHWVRFRGSDGLLGAVQAALAARLDHPD